MIQRAQPKSPNLAVGSAATDLSRLHGKRVAIELSLNRQTRVFCGPAVYELDSQLGNVLRIRVGAQEGEQETGNPEFIIRESQWDGTVLRDTRYGCDFCLTPSPMWPPG